MAGDAQVHPGHGDVTLQAVLHAYPRRDTRSGARSHARQDAQQGCHTPRTRFVGARPLRRSFSPRPNKTPLEPARSRRNGRSGRGGEGDDATGACHFIVSARDWCEGQWERVARVTPLTPVSTPAGKGRSFGIAREALRRHISPFLSRSPPRLGPRRPRHPRLLPRARRRSGRSVGAFGTPSMHRR